MVSNAAKQKMAIFQGNQICNKITRNLHLDEGYCMSAPHHNNNVQKNPSAVFCAGAYSCISTSPSWQKTPLQSVISTHQCHRQRVHKSNFPI